VVSRHGPAVTGDGDPDGRWGTAPGLLGKLVAAVRAEFRAQVLVFDPADPVFGEGACKVASCSRMAEGHGLCSGHWQRWDQAGRPQVEVFAEATSPYWKGQRLTECVVDGCHYGLKAHGLCSRHFERWNVSRQAGDGVSGVDWAVTQSAAPPSRPPGVCRMATCDLWTHRDNPLCYQHQRRWQQYAKAGKGDLGRFLAEITGERGDSAVRVDLRGLRPQLRLELQYALQCRRDETRAKIRPAVAGRVARFLADQPVTSLLEASADQWLKRLAGSKVGDAAARGLLVYARHRVEDLAYGHGWDVEYPRDVWRLRTLGVSDGTCANLRFDRITQPWLRALAKQWARWRISAGFSASHIYLSTAAITRFSRFLAGPDVGVDTLTGVDRRLLERYLADLHTRLAGHRDHARDIGYLNGFFQAIRRHGWDDGALPATAVFFPDDYPEPAQRLPRFLPEHVMAQVEDPANLDKWTDPNGRLVTVILIRAGLRISDAARLPFDCLVYDHDGAPYLRYHNHKMNREALVPIDDELHQMITEHQRQILQRRPAGVPVLFPRRRANLDGTRPIGASTYRSALNRWLQRCQVNDELGRPVHLTPHQWRHTLGTRLINRDVPQEVVRKILDHDSHAMTEHYARLQDTTIRRHWEAAEKVNHRGERVTVDPDGRLADATWARARLARATQALPNGCCALPAVQTCPHANACLTCPMFLTTADYLPQHRAQQRKTLQIITTATEAGHTRVAEMNQQIADNLEKIITALAADPDPQQAADAS
jgi:integrase